MSSFREGLLRARSHIAIIVGLSLATGLALLLDANAPPKAAATQTAQPPPFPASADIPTPPPVQTLTPADRRAAQIAWSYFAANTRPSGLADSVAAYPAATLWDSGSYLLALIAAERLEVIDRAEFDRRAAAALEALQRLPLIGPGVPNKSYDIRSLTPVDYTLRPAPQGVGWSSLDVARMAAPLAILAWSYPRHAEAARKVIARWRMSALAHDGQLFGGNAAGGAFATAQEGRLGYEQYGAASLALLGLPVSQAQQVAPNVAWIQVEGVDVPHDTRAQAHDYATSEPYILYGLEFGLNGPMRELAWRVYQAQAARAARTGVLTAVSEDQLDRDPRFIYSSVLADGTPWSVQTPAGQDAASYRILSTKAAFGWRSLFGTSYGDRLVAAVDPLGIEGQGWQAGRYEASKAPDAVLSANTNAVVLEALHYRVFGPMLHPHAALKLDHSQRRTVRGFGGERSGTLAP